MCRVVSNYSDSVVFLTIVITYDNSRKPYFDTGETPDEIIKAMERNEDKTIIKEFRPMQQTFNFTGDLKIMFDCIRMNGRKDKTLLEKYVLENIDAINENVDLAYYLRELTGMSTIWPDPIKIKGGRQMSILDDAYDKWYGKGFNEGIKKCVLNLKDNGYDENQIAEMLNLSTENVEAILKEQKAG